LEVLFEVEPVKAVEQKIIHAPDTASRINIIEEFLLDKLKTQATIDTIVKSTIDILLSTKGSKSINTILKDNLSKRRQLERKFLKQVGMSPKQLSKVIRLQTALKLLLNQQSERLTDIAYESEYYDQAHFIKDFKDITGTTPNQFLENETMLLSSVIYTKD
jgi:methylphosphotriester-DNA--protein-cysteine methyltransferase